MFFQGKLSLSIQKVLAYPFMGVGWFFLSVGFVIHGKNYQTLQEWIDQELLKV